MEYVVEGVGCSVEHLPEEISTNTQDKHTCAHTHIYKIHNSLGP